jgi:hypothetical protein
MARITKLLVLALVSMLPAPACTAAGAGNSACTVSGVFSQNFLPGPVTVCSVATPTNCFLDWKVGVVSGAAFTSQVTIPAPATISGPQIGIAYSFPFTAATGSTITVAVIAEIRDGVGVIFASDPNNSGAQAVTNSFPPPAITATPPSAVTAAAK